MVGERVGEEWLRIGVPITTSSRGCRGGLERLASAVTTGSRLDVERAFKARSPFPLPPGTDKDGRSCLGMGRSRE